MTARLTWIGTATTLLELGPFAVLTDPNFLHRGEFAYLGKGLVSRRRTEPTTTLDALPPLDAVVLSHLHGDHFDRRAKAGLAKDTPIVTTPASARALQRWGFGRATGLATWQEHVLEKDGARLTVTAVPGTHARGVAKALLPPVMGSVWTLEQPGAAPLRLYVTGDTLVQDDLREIPRRHPDLDVGLWHLGGTRIPGLLGLGLLVTMDGRQGADLLEIVRPRRTYPIHHGDYGVFTDPVETFLGECDRRGLDGVVPLERGAPVDLV